MVANAGSYSTAAPASPIPAKVRYSARTLPACAHSSTHPAASSDPAVIRPRAPQQSSHAPAGTAPAPVTRTLSENAPASVAWPYPRPCCIGSKNAAKE
jgi:hypothetical protein